MTGKSNMQYRMNYVIFIAIILHGVSVSCVFRVVSLQPLSVDSLQPAKTIRDAQILWSEMANARGGVLVNNTRHLVDLIILDVGANTSQQMLKNILDAHEAISNGTYGQVHAMMAPFSRLLAEAHALEAEKRKILSCTGGSAPALFECDESQFPPCTKPSGRRFEYMVGTQCSATTMFSAPLALLRIKGARSIGIVRETGPNDLFFVAARKGVIQTAQNLKMDVVADLQVPSIGILNDSAINSMKKIIVQLQQARPDVVVGATVAQGCLAFVRAAKLMNYTAGQFLMNLCISNATLFREVLGEDGRYVMGPVDWDRRLTGRVYDEDGSLSIHYFPQSNGTKPSSEQFALVFQKRFGYKPSFYAAIAFRCCLAVQWAVETAQSFETEAMRRMINEVNVITFMGQLQFNAFGQIIDNGLGATVQFNRFNEDQLVLPITARATEVVYPMPGWNERTEVIKWYSNSTELAFAIISGTLFFGCIALAILFVAWRDKPQIVASSPLFITLIITGGAMMYASLFFWMLEANDVMCNVRLWLLGVGFVLMFSALLVKTWRIWKIFHDKSLKIIKLDNVYLLKIMAVALAIELIVLALWSGLYPSYAAPVTVDVNRPTLNYRYCTSDQTLPFAVILIVYKGLLIIAAVVLGFWSRKVRSEYNESKFVLISVYNITFAAILMLVLFAINITDRYIDFVIRTVAILWAVTATLCLLLVPKIVYVVTGANDPTKRRPSEVISQDMAIPDTPESVQSQLNHLLEHKRLLYERLALLHASNNSIRVSRSPSSTPSPPNVSDLPQETTNVISTREDLAGENKDNP